MFCTRCGQQILEGQRFCPYCGTEAVNYTQSNEPVNQNAYDPEGTTVLPHYQQIYNTANNSAIYTEEPIYPPMPMKWYKFLIYFALFAGAFINFVYGFNWITGGIYFVQSQGATSAELIYGYYGESLKILDVIYGVSMLGLAVLGIVTRSKLAKYKANAPKFINIFYIIGVICSVLYSVALSFVTGASPVNATLVATIIFQVFIIWAHTKYFRKRAHLFVN